MLATFAQMSIPEYGLPYVVLHMCGKGKNAMIFWKETGYQNLEMVSYKPRTCIFLLVHNFVATILHLNKIDQ